MKFARRSRGLIPISTSPRRGRRPARALGRGLGVEACEGRALLSISLVSLDAAGTAAGNEVSGFSSPDTGDPMLNGPTGSARGNLSADGSKLVFASDATDLVPGQVDTNRGSDVFVRDLTTGQTTLASATLGGQTGNGASYDPVISPDGRYVAFLSLATNLSAVAASPAGLPGPWNAPSPETNGYLYVRDLQTGTTTLLDQTPVGVGSDGSCTGQFVFSPNSQDLAFIDTSDNLTGAPVESSTGGAGGSGPMGGSSSLTYVYVRDLAAGTTSLASVSTGGMASGTTNSDLGGPAADLAFSPDSRSLVFGSSATDLTANPLDGAPSGPFGGPAPSANLFLRDLATGTTTLLSATATGQLPSASSTGAVFSPDGRYVAFTSNATYLTGNPPDSSAATGAPFGPLGAANLYVRDLSTGTTILVSATPGGQLSNGLASSPVFSPDGRSLAYVSGATDLTGNAIDPAQPPGVPPGVPFFTGANVFVTNLATGATSLVSVTPQGQLSSGYATAPAFSPNGRYLAFTSSAGDLTANAPELKAPPSPGSTGGGWGFSGGPGISNVFVRDLSGGTTTLASKTTGGLLPNAASGGLMFSADSGTLYFASGAIDLTNNPPDTSTRGVMPGGREPNNLFATDLATGTTRLITATPSGGLSDATRVAAVLSPDGNTIDFVSNADDLAPGGTHAGSMNIYAASVPAAATPDNQVAFQSWATTAPVSDGQAIVTVDRSGPATGAASVDYTVQDGSAHAGTDYTATSGTLDFAAGQTSATFTVPLAAGDSFTGIRSAMLVLSNPQGASLGQSSATLNLTSMSPTSTPTPTTPTGPGGVLPPWTPGAPISTTPASTTTTIGATPTSMPSPTASPTLSPSPTSTSGPKTPTSTPAPTPTGSTANPSPAPTATTPAEPGPTVLSLTAMKGRRGIRSLVIAFNQALDSTAAQDSANYQVSLIGKSRHGRHAAARVTHPMRIAATVYDAAAHEVTLTLAGRLKPGATAEVAIKGTAGGLTGANGVALNGAGKSKPGEDAVGTLDVGTRRVR